jgi:hypothetical protein
MCPYQRAHVFLGCILYDTVTRIRDTHHFNSLWHPAVNLKSLMKVYAFDEYQKADVLSSVEIYGNSVAMPSDGCLLYKNILNL